MSASRHRRVITISIFWFLTLALLPGCGQNPPPLSVPRGKPGDYLFCLWNVENLFDDKNDGLINKADKEYDEWLGGAPEVLKKKLGKLTEALLKMNDGRGPDILALVEVENERAAELLKGALNAQLKDASWHYKHVVMKEVKVGRHIAPAIITRLPVTRDRTRQYDRRMRTLEVHIAVDGRELIVVATHWTSRKDSGKGNKGAVPAGEEQRERYADQIYGAFKAAYKNNPKVDFLVAGDFNDTPGDESVIKHLRAVGDMNLVKQGGDEPYLFNLMAGRDPEQFGTHYYGKPLIFDQVAVSPGLLDEENWKCDVESIRSVALTRPGDRLRRPWRFGGPKEQQERGYSDHFPVTVRLTLAASGVLAAR